MRSVQVGMWDPHPPSKQHAPALAPSHQPQPRLSHVSAPPAKRITFYKSGDSQFGGVKMAVHKRSFKCFDALLDDLSQKVPLPFGVRTVTTPRGTHTISHLEQLQDGGCYLCSDRRQAKPINMEIATKHPRTWSHQGRRPHRPESDSATPPGHVPYRQRRLLLVKNTEPGVRRSVVLSRRVTRSLRAFLEEASDVMQFHVRKLYTVEGRKIDNVQSLMTCPNVLVCVGREAFSPLLVNYIHKSSDEKLPGLGTRTPGNGAKSPPLGTQSRASENSESPDSKKNTVNFGLETKKSIIHPRSDSSTRSARFSVSSEKSYGLSTVSQGRATILNDDIEKRVVVNKDGSLSVEMRVRFRLHSDETLQWSTRIKKSPSLTNDSCSASQGQPHYLQPGSCSDPDCNSFEPETTDYTTQCAMDVNRCPCCYPQEQQYDLWENPAHIHKQPVPPSHSTAGNHTILRHTHSSSSSSSCNSTRVVRCRARLTNCKEGSERSQIVQEEVCVTEQHIVEQEVCTVSRCCSRNEVIVNSGELGPHSCKSGEEEVERPMSAISASSHVLQELKEDEDEELPPSASRCSREQSPTSEIQTDGKAAQQNGGEDEGEASTCQCPSISGVEDDERANTAKSCKSTKEMATDDVEEVIRVLSGLSAGSRQSASTLCPNCGGWKVKSSNGCNSRASNCSNKNSPKPATPNSGQDKDDSGSDVSKLSNRSNLTSHREVSMMNNGECSASVSKNEESAAEEIRAASVSSSHKSNNSRRSVCKDQTVVENRSPSVISAKSDTSNCNADPDLAPTEDVDGENAPERAASATSSKSGTSAKTSSSRKSTIKVTAPSTAEDEENRVASKQSENSNVSAKESRPSSGKSAKSQGESRAPSVLSVKSNESAQVDRPASAQSTTSQIEKKKENAEEEARVASALSVKSNESRSASPMSIKSNKSSANEVQNLEVKSNGKESRPGSVLSVKSAKSDVSKKSNNTKGETRASSVISVKSNATNKTSKSHVSKKSAQDEIKNMEENNESVGVKSNVSAKESRPVSKISNKSANSEKSSKNKVKNVDEETRAASVISAEESRPASVKSSKSSKSHVSEKSSKSEKIEKLMKGDSVTSSKSNASDQAKQSFTSPRSNAEKDQEEREGSALSDKSRKSDKLDCEEIVQNEVDRSASAISDKSSLSVKSSTSASPAKDKEEDRALTPASGKSNSSAISGKSKKSNQTEISTNAKEDNDNKSECVSIKSGTCRKFHVITIKTPDLLNINRPVSSASANTNVSSGFKDNKMAGDETEHANESLVEDQAPKNAISNQTQELMPENGEQTGSSSLSVRSGKSSKSRCSCGKKKEIDQTKESEVAANTSTPKKDDYEDDSFASVSLVLPEDPESQSESSLSSQRNVSKTTTPEVSKSAENMEDKEQVSPNNPNTNDIPTIETPGDNDKDAVEEKSRVASSCSTKSTHSVKSRKSKKSCSNCGKLKTKTDASGTASPDASEKSIETTRTDQLMAPDKRTTSAMSNASCRSQRKLVKCEYVDNGSEESGEQTSKDKEETKVARAKSNSPCRLRPKSSGSNQSKTNSMKAKDDSASVHSVKSSQSKETNTKPPTPQDAARPASKGDTRSESILSHSLSAADLLKQSNAQPPDSPRSKCSKSSAKSTKSQKSKKEAAPELTPSCLPNASPNEVVSDWLKSIPANVLALGDEDGLEEKSGGAMDGENGAGAEEEAKEEEAVKTEECEGGEEEGAKEQGKGDVRPNGMVPESSLPKSWHPSATVMKVLLSSSLGRCRSMPEVSPVYGRRLSTSAKDLLDCLAQLQLIEPAGHQAQQPQFEDIISILQSLWLNEPRDIAIDHKDPSGTDQVSPPRSSSGVGMSSGSGGSGKDNGNHEEAEANAQEQEASENPDSPKVSDNPSSLDKNSKSPTDNELDTHEGSNSGSPPAVAQAPVTEKQAHDPDPVWVLHLLKKLEKQFISHYINAMTDFKVKWDLEDSLILDRMIVELKDEVSLRIQKSVDKEVRKIQSRAGKAVRAPRPPPVGNLSQDSAMTEKRRQRLKVMKNQSVKTGDSMSDEDLNGENSDQRSDDEYCPCETCIRKKMAARPFKTNPSAIEAPVSTEFDLFRILQHKKTPPVMVMAEIVQEEPRRTVEEDNRNLEVVQEEEEEEESNAEAETSESLDTEEGAEEDKCECHGSEEDSDEQTEESDKETIREKSSQKEVEEEEEGEDTSEEASTEERASEQESVPAVCVTEGEEADVEDSGTEKSEHEETETKTPNTTDVPPPKPKDVSLLHQCTRTSVESQPGSLDDIDDCPGANNMEVPKLASPGGTPLKRSRSPARVKRRKAKNSDSDLENV